MPQSPLKMLFSGIAILFAGIFMVIGALLESIADAFNKPPPSLPEVEPTKIETLNTGKLIDEVALLTKAAEFPDVDTFMFFRMRNDS
jgi:hypothetical protein